MRSLALLSLSCVAVAACVSAPVSPMLPGAEVRGAIEQVLDDFHAAASAADEERYFGHFAPEGVFLGTDATERWTVEEFRGYVHPYFAAGRGWTYVVVERHVTLGARPSGDAVDVAWFDERLDNAKYGETRGSGVLRRVGGTWKVAQYNLTIPIPNELSLEVVERIRAGAARP